MDVHEDLHCHRSPHEHEQQSQIQARTADKQYSRRPFPPFPLYLSNPKHKKVSLTLRTSACSLCALHALGGEKIPLLLSFVVGVSRMPSFLFSSEVGLALLPIVVIAISSRYTGSTTLTVSYEGTCRGHLEEKHPGSCFYEVAFSDISVPSR